MRVAAEEHLLKPLDVVSEPKSVEEEGGLTGDSLTNESRKRKNPFKSRKTVWIAGRNARIIGGDRVKSREPPGWGGNVGTIACSTYLAEWKGPRVL
jgi:hypothetical protein